MNIYRYSFKAECPEDGEIIDYSLELRVGRTILAADIKAECERHKVGLQEDIAAAIRKNLNCGVILKAVHQGVEAETHLGVS